MEPIIAFENNQFVPAPQGLWKGVCVDVIDLGKKSTKWGEKRLLRVVWQLDKRMEDGRPFSISRPCTPSVHKESTLRKLAEPMLGRPLSGEELKKGFNLETLIARNCLIQVVHKKGDNDQTYANVQTIVPLMEGTPLLHPENYIRVIEREEEES